MHHDMLSPFHSRHADHAMKMIRSHDLDCVQIFLLVQQFAKIGVGRAALERVGGPLLGVIGFNNILCHIAAARNDTVARGPVGITERAANGIEEAFFVPVTIPFRSLIGIANCNNLDLWRGEQRRHLSQALGADANIRQCDLVARSDASLASQYMSWNDGERSRGCSPQKRATILFGCHVSLPEGTRSIISEKRHSKQRACRLPIDRRPRERPAFAFSELASREKWNSVLTDP